VNFEHGLTISCSMQFGELELELTAERANIGAAVGAVFG
jgi:hypothetical protein